MKIKKVIIPAAGLGTRFLPATKSQPKEMLPIVDKPAIQHLVEEAVESGITEIIIVTGKGKRSIEDHFDFSYELAAHLRKKGQLKLLNEIEKIEKLAKFVYVRQPFPQGDGHAILCAKELVENEPFAVLFGDDIYDSKKPALAQLIEQYEQLQTPIIGLHEIEKKDSTKYGMVKSTEINKHLHKIISLIEKPAPSKAPSNLAIAGKYIVTPELMSALKKTKASGPDKEIRLIDGMKDFVKNKNNHIHGYNIQGTRFDTGDKLGYLKSVVHFGLKHKELSAEFRKYLKSIDFAKEIR